MKNFYYVHIYNFTRKYKSIYSINSILIKKISYNLETITNTCSTVFIKVLQCTVQYVQYSIYRISFLLIFGELARE